MGPTFAAEAKSPQQQDVGILCEKRLIRKKSISVTYFEWLRLIRKTVVLDEAASTSISQIIKTQKYDIEDASFPVDLVFIVDGQSYHMNSQSGQIFGINGVSAVLSEEALQEVLSLLANE